MLKVKVDFSSTILNREVPTNGSNVIQQYFRLALSAFRLAFSALWNIQTLKWSMESIKYFVKELAHFHVPVAKDSISDLICKWCRLSNPTAVTSALEIFFLFIIFWNVLLILTFIFSSNAKKRMLITFLFDILNISLKWKTNAWQANGQHTGLLLAINGLMILLKFPSFCCVVLPLSSFFIWGFPLFLLVSEFRQTHLPLT